MASPHHSPFTVPETLPYRHLNLCRNPFGVPLERERPALAIANVCHWADQLQNARVAIQLIGDHGRGKSSHLFALKNELETRTNTQVPYIRLRDTHRIPAAPIVLLDEGARLPIRPWWRLRHIRSLALSTHRNMRALVFAFGFFVTTIQIQQGDPSGSMRFFHAVSNGLGRVQDPYPSCSTRRCANYRPNLAMTFEQWRPRCTTALNR